MENINCYNCDSCYDCYCCDHCNYCVSCYNLRMTEYNYFCWSEKLNDENSYQQKKYRVFNVEISKEEYNNIDIIYNKLELDNTEHTKTRYQTAFKKMWDKLEQKEKQRYFNIPHFNRE